eukprot:918018-Alexandrium_andersonii.AAC.1
MTAPSVVRFGICARSGAERIPRKLRVPLLRPFLGPRSSSSECLKQCCVSDAGFRPAACAPQP